MGRDGGRGGIGGEGWWEVVGRGRDNERGGKFQTTSMQLNKLHPYIKEKIT